MNKFLRVVFWGLGALMASQYVQAMNVSPVKIGYVYQLNLSDTTGFDFQVPDRPNSCGSRLYRSYSADEHVANRKFSLVLTAFVADKRISFYERDTCEGDRALVGWIRLVN